MTEFPEHIELLLFCFSSLNELIVLMELSDDNDDVIGYNQCRCLPKAELNTKNSTKRQLCCRLVEFLVFNSITHVG